MCDIVERLHTLARGDHDRDCQGREYHCGCGFDEQAWKAADEAADLIEALTAELAEARDKSLDEAAGELERLDGFGEWHEAAQTIRALKSPKPPIL